MSVTANHLPWAARQRIEFIEHKLFWEGSINRSDIIEKFRVSVPQASKDLAFYQEVAPENLDYDRRAKHYVAREKFDAKIIVPDANAHLNQIVERSAQSDTLLSHMELPKADTLPQLGRQLDPMTLRRLSATARERRSIEILYQSMNPKRIDPVWRAISPHAFGTDGARWHVRAFCHMDETFKDFLLSRCLETGDFGEQASDPEDDWQWHERMDVVLAPNPKLSREQRMVIAADFGMREDKLVVSVRKSFLFYFLRRYRLDLPDFTDDPREAPIVIENRALFDKALEPRS